MSAEPPVKDKPNRRRSQRLLLNMPILVQPVSGAPKSALEETHTLVVNAHGALITLTMNVKPGQQIVLKNKKSQEAETCRVVYLRPVEFGKNQVGVEFVKPAPRFWHISFPPEDWLPWGANPGRGPAQ